MNAVRIVLAVVAIVAAWVALLHVARAVGAEIRYRREKRKAEPIVRFTPPVGSPLFAQLHVGDPGPDGTANIADEARRQPFVLAASPEPHTIANVDPITWANITGSQHVTHFSAWNDRVDGEFAFAGTATAVEYAPGDTFTFQRGALTFRLHDRAIA